MQTPVRAGGSGDTLHGTDEGRKSGVRPNLNRGGVEAIQCDTFHSGEDGEYMTPRANISLQTIGEVALVVLGKVAILGALGLFDIVQRKSIRSHRAGEEPLISSTLHRDSSCR